jgi:hypothetical protein
MCGVGGGGIDGKIPSIDKDIAALSDFANHHVESIDVVVADEILKLVAHRWSRGDDQISVRRDFGGIDDPIQISLDVHEIPSGVTVSVRLDGSSKIGSSDGDVCDVRAELQEQLAHLIRHGRESFKWKVASHDGGAERDVRLLQLLDNESAEQSASLVAEQEHQSLVFIRSNLHRPIVDRKRR